MAAKVGLGGRVFAVEAASEMRRKLRAAINRSGVPKIRNIVTYLDCAVSDENGSMEFNYVPTAAGLSGLRRQSYPDGSMVQTEMVDVRRLDDIIPPETRLRFIKMDIEGAEYHALRGARTLIKDARPMIIFEYSGPRSAETYGYSREAFFGFWQELDYVLLTFAGGFHGPQDWGHAGPHDLLAVPREIQDDGRAILHAAAICAATAFLPR